MNERRYSGAVDRLRDPQSVKMMELERIVWLSLEGIDAKTMLDAGTGSAVFAERFQKAGLKVAGIDINPRMIEAAREYVPEGDFQAAPAESVPWSDDSFDLVFMGFLLHEADDYVKVLAEALRLARLRIAVLEFPKRAQPFGPPPEHRLSEEQIREFASRAGLEPPEIVELTHLVLYRFDL